MTTNISIDPPSAQLQRLEATSPMTARIALAIDDQPRSLGNQYLLIALPLGSVQIEHPRQLFTQFIRERFALAGIEAEIVNQEATADLTVSLHDISLSAYDLVLTRRLVATVELMVASPGVEGLVLSESATEFRQFGFEPQLKPLLVEALRAVCDRLLPLVNTRRRKTL